MIAIATLSANTHQPRILILNRSYTTEVEIHPSVGGYNLTSATVTKYTNDDLSANNETDPNAVSLTTETIQSLSPFAVTVPAHSLLMLEFQ